MSAPSAHPRTESPTQRARFEAMLKTSGRGETTDENKVQELGSEMFTTSTNACISV